MVDPHQPENVMRSNAENRNRTHNPVPVDRANFRAQATGTGTTVAKSRAVGAMRAAEVSEYMPAAQRAALPKHGGGYPAPAADFEDSML
jgi:hypothetical protein